MNVLLAKATAVIGSAKAAEEWLSTPCQPLSYRKPIDFTKSDEDLMSAEAILARIEHGVFS